MPLLLQGQEGLALLDLLLAACAVWGDRRGRGEGLRDHSSSLAGGSAAQQEHPHLLAHAKAPWLFNAVPSLLPEGSPSPEDPLF